MGLPPFAIAVGLRSEAVKRGQGEGERGRRGDAENG